MRLHLGPGNRGGFSTAASEVNIAQCPSHGDQSLRFGLCPDFVLGPQTLSGTLACDDAGSHSVANCHSWHDGFICKCEAALAHASIDMDIAPLANFPAERVGGRFAAAGGGVSLSVQTRLRQSTAVQRRREGPLKTGPRLDLDLILDLVPASITERSGTVTDAKSMSYGTSNRSRPLKMRLRW
jgi:hypothetical protein